MFLLLVVSHYDVLSMLAILNEFQSKSFHGCGLSKHHKCMPKKINDTNYFTVGVFWCLWVYYFVQDRILVTMVSIWYSSFIYMRMLAYTCAHLTCTKLQKLEHALLHVILVCECEPLSTGSMRDAAHRELALSCRH